jgi:hypothetical protein
VVAGRHEQTDAPDLQDPELADLSRRRDAIGSCPMARKAQKRHGSLSGS